jgi:aryl-alcohol dehydrogenase-like predicted oxidoreductase
MNYLNLPGTTLKISKCCLGTMTWGEQNTEKDAHEQLDYAVSRGINFIDTAEMYPVPAKAETQGRTESYIGSWLKKQKRDSLVLATKVAGPARGMEWIRGGEKINLTRRQILEACENSLKRLQTDYLDLYQIHWPGRNVPMFGQTFYDPSKEYPDTIAIEEQLEALQELIQSGKVRNIGVSNETPWGVMKFKEISRQNGLPEIKTIQNPFNLINRIYENGLAEACHRENLSLLVYSPLAFGLLSGKYLTDPKTQGRMSLFPNFGARYLKPFVTEAVQAYRELAVQHSLTPAQMAIAWVNSRWYAASTIIGATTLTQLKENIDAFDIKLSDEILNGIETIHRQYPSPAQ